MSAFRKNAFLIDFSNLPKLPKQEEAHLFVHQKLNLGYDDVDSIQLSNSKFALIVECASMELAINTVNKHDKKQFIEVDKKRYQISLCMDDGGTDVKIHDLPPKMDNKLIVEWMSQYGEIISIRDFKWNEKVFFKNKDNGVRVVRIKLQKAIPSYITVHGEETYITNKNQIPTCRHCGYKAHRGRGCTENKLVLGEKEGLSVNNRMERARTSYAEIVSTSTKNVEKSKYQERMEEEEEACGVEAPNEKSGSSVQVTGSSMMTGNTKVRNSGKEQCEVDNKQTNSNELRSVNNAQKSDMEGSQTIPIEKLTLAGVMELDSEESSDDTNTEQNSNEQIIQGMTTNTTNKTEKIQAKHKLSDTDTTDEDRGKLRPRRKR